MTYFKMVKILTAIRCHNSGMTVKEIATGAKVSESTIRRWLKEAPQ